MDIAAIESRRQDIKRRMAALDRLSTSDARALDKAMTEMCALYAEYAKLAGKEQNVLFGGRLGQYKYYDMDKVIAEALAMAAKEGD